MKTKANILFLAVLLAALLALVLAWGGLGAGKNAGLQSELDKTLQENQSLRETNRRLGLEIDALNHRKDYLEKLARENLGLIGKDDLIFDIKPAVVAPSPAAGKPAAP